jgi:hypothetical protein
MFNKPTVFILGAGASWHYGYPLGETLVERVIEEGLELAAFYRDFRGHGQYMTAHARSKSGAPTAQCDAAQRDCEELVKGLKQVNPPVVDYFLGHNASVQGIGRLLIALVILRAQTALAAGRRNRNRDKDGHADDPEGRNFHRQDDWCRFINYQLAVGCRGPEDLVRNRVSFITFNYDLSLERELHRGLSAIEIFGPDGSSEFLKGSRVVHIYGRAASDHSDEFVTAPRPQKPIAGDQIYRYVTMIDTAYLASQQIKTIAPDQKDDNHVDIMIARKQLNDAQRIYILGYGFDPENSRLLELITYLSHTQKKRVYFTNLMDSNRINKRASEIFFGNDRRISSQTPLAEQEYERSNRDVYGALSLDFDL